MNKEKQRREILRFLKGKGNKDVDAFCIYQWIERCHFHGWWDIGIALAPSVPPNSLDQDYHKRLNYLLYECRSKLKASTDNLGISERRHIRTVSAKPSANLNSIDIFAFESRSKETLRQIYSVLYFMGYYEADFPDAIRSTMKVLNVNDYQTICDKCARRFAGTVDKFKSWYHSGEILQKLDETFSLSPDDYIIFRDMLAKQKR